MGDLCWAVCFCADQLAWQDADNVSVRIRAIDPAEF